MSTRNVHLLPVSGLPPGCVVSVLPAALRRPQKKHAPGFWEHVSCVFCRLLLMCMNLPALGSPSRVRLCGGCLRRFGDLRKNTPLEFWSMYLVDLVNFHRFWVPPTTRWSMCLPAALRRPQKKHAPGFLEHVSCGFCRLLLIFVDFRVPPALAKKPWLQNCQPPPNAARQHLSIPPPMSKGGAFIIPSRVTDCRLADLAN